MTTVRHVNVQLTPERIIEGFYTYDGETVTMVMRDGSPATIHGDLVTEKAHPDHVTITAKRLTRQIRKSMLGDTVPGFEKRSLEYQYEGVA